MAELALSDKNRGLATRGAAAGGARAGAGPQALPEGGLPAGLTVGFIGGGSMGGSIAQGLVAAGALPASQVMVADHGAARRAAFAAAGMPVFEDEDGLLAAEPAVVVLAVKPQVLGALMERVAERVAGRLVVSIAAGVTLATLEAALPGARVVRAMPNLPVQVLSGATAIAAGASATAADVECTRLLFSAVGAAAVMREDQLEVEGAVVGTAPAFFSLLVDTLTRAGVRAGLPSAAARELLLATMEGTAVQLRQEGAPHPRAYMEKVTSPGGTTAAALFELEPRVLEGSYAAVDAALARSAELARKA